jgi:hypothetical protein
MENIIVVASIIMIQSFQIIYSMEKYPASSVYTLYLSCVVYLIAGLYFSLKKYPQQYYDDPPEGRYVDYRIDPNYIAGLSKKNRQKHFKKFPLILQKNGMIKQHFEKNGKYESGRNLEGEKK